MAPSWTRGEMLAVAASSFIASDDVALVGLGLPQIAAGVAQRTHAKGVHLLLEIGVFDPVLAEPSMGIADHRMWTGAVMHGSMLDALGYMLHGGRVSLGLLGTLEVDPRGSINTTMVPNPDGTCRRFNGSGGGNDIASLAGRVVVVMRHDSRKFKPAVHFLTSPGCRLRGSTRAAAGLPGDGTVAIVTDRAVISVTPSGAGLESVHPGEDVDDVVAMTPMDLEVSRDIPTTADPTADQLAIIRNELDPHRWYTA